MKLHAAAITLILAAAQALDPEGGCYKRRGDSMRHHNTFTYQSRSLCMRACGQHGYHYAALKGVRCDCGTEEPLERYQIPEENCNIPCSGWSKDICGGKKAWSIYTTDHWFKEHAKSSDKSSSKSGNDISSTSESQSTPMSKRPELKAQGPLEY